MGATLALDDIPDDILIEILTFTWTLSPKRMCRRISNLYDKHVPNKLFQCLVSDLHTKPSGDIPTEVLQFVYETDRPTFDDIVLADLVATSETYCFDHASFKPIETESYFRCDTIKDHIVRNKDFDFAYTNKSILSNMCLHKSNQLVHYVLDLLVSRLESTIIFKHPFGFNFSEGPQPEKSGLRIVMINALALGAGQIATHIKKLLEEKPNIAFATQHFTYGNTSYAAILSLLLAKSNELKLCDKFATEVHIINILDASIVKHSDTIFDNVFANTAHESDLTSLIEMITTAFIHDNLHVFKSLLKYSTIVNNLFTKITISQNFRTQRITTLVNYLHCVCESKFLFLDTFNKNVRSQHYLSQSDSNDQPEQIPRPTGTRAIYTTIWIDFPHDLNFSIEVLGATGNTGPSGDAGKLIIKSHLGSKRQTKRNLKSFQSRPKYAKQPVPKSLHKKSHR